MCLLCSVSGVRCSNGNAEGAVGQGGLLQRGVTPQLLPGSLLSQRQKLQSKWSL